ncbi:hypothetical protein [Halorussus aquaticus]|uniref:hypothetical protein n=1 Tax=Halorussus aquaticus TaxID=2953748 RepID=UPI0034A3915D
MEARKDILQISLNETPISDDVNISDIAKKTDDFSGADLAAVVKQAKYLALRDGTDTVRMEHFSISVARRAEAQT